MSEREGTPEDFARMFGEPSEGEGQAEGGGATPDPGPKGGPSGGAGAAPRAEPGDGVEDPERAHNAFLVELFHGSPQKREADRKFFESLSGPTEGDAR